MKITNPQYFAEQLEYAREIGDNTLFDCLKRCAFWEQGKCEDQPEGWPYDDSRYGSEVNIHKDYDKHSFYFEWMGKDGRLIMNGGIIFHGNPGEPDTSHSVTLDRQYGWSIHT